MGAGSQWTWIFVPVVMTLRESLKSCFGARGGVDCEMWGILPQWDTVIEESRARKGEAGCLLRFWWSGKAFWKPWYNRTSKGGWDMAR